MVRNLSLALPLLALASCSDSSTDVDPLEITTTSLPDGAPALSYETVLEASGGDGGPYTWDLATGSDPLPEGLDLASDGTISGVPLLNGTSAFTMTVTGNGQTDDTELSITVAPDCHVADCSSLEGYWRMDEASLTNGATVADGSGNNRPGTVVTDDATDKSTTGQRDGAIALDGTADYVSVPHDDGFDLDADFTLATWINTSIVDEGYQAIISKSSSPTRPASLWVYDAAIEVWFTPGGQQSASDDGLLTADTWHHLVATYDATEDEIRIYVDGVLNTATDDAGGPGELNEMHLALGQRGDDNFFFTGALDEVMIWSRALGDGEVGDLYAELD